MPDIDEVQLQYLQLKTKLQKETLKGLSELSSPVKQYIRDQLENIILGLRAELSHIQFSSQLSNVAAARIRSTLSLIDPLFEPLQRIYKIANWVDLAKRSVEFSQLLDLINKNMNKVPASYIGGIKIPGLQGVNSIEELVRQKEELSFNLQQMVSAQHWAEVSRAKIDSAILECQRWINALMLLDGSTHQTYTFTGNFFSKAPNGVGWIAGTLRYFDTTYIIIDDSIISLPEGINYLYFDTGGASNTFASTQGEHTAVAEDRIKIATLTVTNGKATIIVPVGEVEL
jgi:hypothetical protein